MIEMIALGLLFVAVMAGVLPLIQDYSLTKRAAQLPVPQDSTLRRHYITELRNQNARLAAAVEKRVALAG